MLGGGVASPLPGFAQPARQAQAVFRAILDAISRPGRIVTLPSTPDAPAPFNPATNAILLCLVDFETPLWLDAQAAAQAAVARHIRFHTGAPLVQQPGAAAFAVITDARATPHVDAFDRGSEEYPERAATLIVQVASLEEGVGRRLAGPGLENEARLTAHGLPERVWEQLGKQRVLFPCGIDIILTAGCRVAAIPRTTEIDAAQARPEES